MAQPNTQIDASKVIWDQPEAIDPAKVQWDEPARPASGSPAIGAARSAGAQAVGEAALNLGANAILAPASGLAGLLALPFGSDTAANVISQVQGLSSYLPNGEGAQRIENVAAIPFRKLGQLADWLGEGAQQPGLLEKATGVETPKPFGTLGATLLNTAAQTAVPGVSRTSNLGSTASRVPSAEASKIASSTQRQAGLAPVSEAAPSTQALKQASQQAYKRADEAGLALKPESVQSLKSSISETIEKSGGADPTLHPDTSAALKRISDMEPTTLQDLDRMRQIAKDAAGSIKPADRRLARQIVERIDDYGQNLKLEDVTAGDINTAVPAMKDARDLWSRYSKSEIIDEAVRKAETNASQYSQSGVENALRVQFRQIARQMDKTNPPAKYRGFTAEEKAAIRRIATGGPVENALRFLGKFAPHGVVSSAVLGVLGHATGGAGALAAAGGAELARMGATRMTKANVARASELVRRGRGSRNALAGAPARNALVEAP